MTPTSEARFRSFKRRLAARVRLALKRGWRVSAKDSDVHGPRNVCCPLGSHPNSDGPKPGEWDAGPLWGIHQHQAFAFACGFDGDDVLKLNSYIAGGMKVSPKNPYYLLGQEYRRRFP